SAKLKKSGGGCTSWRRWPGSRRLEVRSGRLRSIGSRASSQGLPGNNNPEPRLLAGGLRIPLPGESAAGQPTFHSRPTLCGVDPPSATGPHLSIRPGDAWQHPVKAVLVDPDESRQFREVRRCGISLSILILRSRKVEARP